MISRFFIDRPIFATVLSVVITLIGGIALFTLPIAQYPPITPPSVQVSISYPGASAQVVADTVAAPIEQQVNGVPGMLYMSSQSGNDGSYSLSVTFDVGTNLNTALVMVQNRVKLAMPLLPTQVQNQGISIRKKTPDILMVINFFSPDGRYDDIYLSNFTLIHLKDELLRVDGVSDISILGERDYSIRAWLDPQKLAARSMTANDVADAIRRQNLEAAIGRVGQPPVGRGQSFQLPIDTLGRLSDPEQFGKIIVKVRQNAPPAQQRSMAKSGARSSAMPGSGIADPLQAAASMRKRQTTDSPTSASTSSSAMSGTTVAGVTTSGGGSTGGGATAGGGGGTAGGAGTTTISNLAINGTGGGAVATGAGATIGRLAAAPGRMPPEPSAEIVRLRDVARVELGAQNYNLSCTFDRHPSVGMAIFQLPGTNALDVADRVRRRMKELQVRFPAGIDYTIAYDTTPFIRDSIADVVRTLFEAVFLVGVVVLVFLQSWRTVLIPMVAVPVAIVGTFAVMALVGFSLNNISLFGLVLAIGIVVDDAIVVVENVERWLEHGLPPREATQKAMEEVTGPIIAVALVLCAVFVPCAFIGGITGRFFRQFAVTIAASTVFSAINSLTLSPALAAILLRPRGPRRDPVTWLLDVSLGWFFRVFNKSFAASTAAYGWLGGRLLRISAVVVVAYAGLLILTYWLFSSAPTGFVPQQDQGRIIAGIQLPDAASLQRTQATMAQVEKIAKETPGVAHTLGIAGMSFVQQANGSNFGSMFIVLEPFEKRRSPELRDVAIMAKLRREWARHVKDGQVIVFGAPPVPGVSVAGGFKLMVEDRGGLGLPDLQRQTDVLVRKLAKLPGLAGVSSPFRSNIPQLYMDVDRTKVAALGVSFNDVNQALLIYLGSLYVNSFNEFGRHWQVTLQADGKFRSRLEYINLLEVRNKSGQMVPLGTLVNVREIGGPIFVTRYNLATSAAVTGNLLPGISSGTAIAEVQALANRSLPRSMKTEWTELVFVQQRAGNTAGPVFLAAVLCVFLALASLYESWSLPLAVILVVPLSLLCSIAGVIFTDDSVNIFVQIGLVVLVGLACKNAILVVEFAKQLHQEGKPLLEATQEASRLRLRPILMTSFAFIFGVIPLVIATGAGAEMRRSLGTAVFSGMLGVTLFGIFVTPVFFYVIQGLGEARVFRNATVQWVGSGLVGGTLGLLAGYLLSRLDIVSLEIGLPAAAGAGALTVLLIFGMSRMVRSADKETPR